MSFIRGTSDVKEGQEFFVAINNLIVYMQYLQDMMRKEQATHGVRRLSALQVIITDMDRRLASESKDILILAPGSDVLKETLEN